MQDLKPSGQGKSFGKQPGQGKRDRTDFFLRHHKENGVITVFVTLLLLTCLLFAGTALESARRSCVKTGLASTLDVTLTSLMGNYDGDLFDTFGIFALNRESLQGRALEDTAKDLLTEQIDPTQGRLFAGRNLLIPEITGVTVTETQSAVGTKGAVLFGTQVLAYMKYRSLDVLLDEVKDQLSAKNDGEDAKKRSEEGKLDRPEVELPQETEVNEDGEVETKEPRDVWDEVDSTFLGSLDSLKSRGILELVVPRGKSVSDRHSSKSYFPSVERNTVESSDPAGLSDPTLNILYCQYLMEEFGCYTGVKSDKEELVYELEYILEGEAYDADNLKKTCEKLVLLREGLNLVTLATTSSLSEQSRSFAVSVAGWTGLEPVISFVQVLTNAAWAYAESLTDVRTLLSGGVVPMRKGESDWTLSLTDAARLISGSLTAMGKSSSGSSYEEYLRLLLLAVPENEKIFRTMDMIQTRLIMENPGFRMRDCLFQTGLTVTATVSDVFMGLETTGEMTIKVSQSRMY